MIYFKDQNLVACQLCTFSSTLLGLSPGTNRLRNLSEASLNGTKSQSETRSNLRYFLLVMIVTWSSLVLPNASNCSLCQTKSWRWIGGCIVLFCQPVLWHNPPVLCHSRRVGPLPRAALALKRYILGDFSSKKSSTCNIRESH